MIRRKRPSRVAHWTLTAALLVTVCTSPLMAQQREIKQLPSLGMVPADCAFYGAMLRGKEQYDMLVNSNAFKKLMGLSFVQLGMQQFQQELENNPEMGQVMQLLQLPENQELLKVLADGASKEVFVYGDDTLATTFQLLNSVSGAMRQAQLEMAANGGDQEMLQTKMMEFVLANQGKIKIPELVLGMQISDTAAAKRQIERLKQLKPMLEGSPLAGAATTEQVGNATMYTINIKGSMLPLEELEEEADNFDSEEAKAAMGKIIDLIKGKTLALTVGLRGNHLIFSIGPTSQHLASLGTGKVLSLNPKMRPLAKHINKPLVSVDYLSADFLKVLSSTESQMNDLATMVSAATELAPIPEDVKKALKDDSKRLAKAVSEMVPEPGALLSFGFLNDRGYESYSYSWSETAIDASKPLTILDHVGGNPIFFAAGRAKKVKGDPESAKYWAGRFDFYLNNLVMPNLPPAQQQMAKDMLTKFKPLLAEAGKINSTLLGPALEDGQSAFVFDGKVMSAQPHRSMPKPENQLPLPETAIVMGVSDEAKMSQGVAEYFSLGDKMIEAARGTFPNIPPLKVPRPIPQPLNGANVSSYPIALLIGLDMSIAPNGGIGNGVSVMSMTPETTARLINAAPLTSSAKHLAMYANKPLGSAFRVNFADLMSMVSDWVEYGIDVNNPGDESVNLIKTELKVVFEFLSCMREASGASYMEDGATVTHAETVFQDIAE